MMVCGQVGALGLFADIANSLTHLKSQKLEDSQKLCPLFTGCGVLFHHVDSLFADL
jgi:hypothetical protein